MIPVGIDISKEKIDVCIQGDVSSLPNTKKAILKFFKPYVGKELQVVMESTGIYHRLSHELLHSMNISVMIINPYQSRNFAKAMNIACKTDKVDAIMLATYAERMAFTKSTPLSTCAKELQALQRHLADLKQTHTQYVVRLKDASGYVASSTQLLMSMIERQIKGTVEKIACIVQKDKNLKARKDILSSIPGVGERTAFALMALMPELGKLTRNAACALSGLAPMDFSSGKYVGKKRIQKGRHDVRMHLYMPMLGAVTKHNKTLKVFYDRLVKSGKPKKVAITAAMRKFIVIANGLLNRGELWQNMT
jgi:transposase